MGNNNQYQDVCYVESIVGKPRNRFVGGTGFICFHIVICQQSTFDHLLVPYKYMYSPTLKMLKITTYNQDIEMAIGNG